MNQAAAAKAPPFVNPWQRLYELPHVRLRWHVTGPMGLADHDAQTISLRNDLNGDELRCTLQHELVHLERGPTLSTLHASEEFLVRRITARLLIPAIEQLADVLAWAGHDFIRAATALRVDLGVLRDRLNHLDPAEHDQVLGCLLREHSRPLGQCREKVSPSSTSWSSRADSMTIAGP